MISGVSVHIFVLENEKKQKLFGDNLTQDLYVCGFEYAFLINDKIQIYILYHFACNYIFRDRMLEMAAPNYMEVKQCEKQSILTSLCAESIEQLSSEP